MNSLKFLLVITAREYGETISQLLDDRGKFQIFCSLGNGTASQKTLDYLGIEKTEQMLLCSMVTSETAKQVLRDLVLKMNIDIPGHGIAVTIPVESVGGSTALEMLTGTKSVGNEENNMEDFKYSMIISITEKGGTDLVMEAARSVGAKGGTVVHAKGTGTEDTAKFFGVSIAAEKELVYIVAKRQDRDVIMKAIMEKAGIHTASKAIVFSLPVDRVAGLRSITGETDEF